MSSDLTKPKLLKLNVELEKRIQELEKQLVAKDEALKEKVEKKDEDKLEKVLSLLLAKLGEEPDAKEKEFARTNNSYLVPPTKPINDMILLEYDKWRLEELKKRLENSNEGSDMNKEYKRLIKELYLRIVTDFQETQRIDPKVAKPFQDLFKEAQEESAKLAKRISKAKKELGVKA